MRLGCFRLVWQITGVRSISVQLFVMLLILAIGVWLQVPLLWLLSPVSFLLVLALTYLYLLANFSHSDIAAAMKGAVSARTLDQAPSFDRTQFLNEVETVAARVRKEGVGSIESFRQSIQNTAFSEALRLAAEGFDAASISSILDSQAAKIQERLCAASNLWMLAADAGPVVGVLLSLLGTMGALLTMADPSAQMSTLLAGALYMLAISLFVSLYFFQVWSQNLIHLAGERRMESEALKISVIGILEGQNPAFLSKKIKSMMSSPS